MVMRNTMMIDACDYVNYTSTMRSTIYIYIYTSDSRHTEDRVLKFHRSKMSIIYKLS